MLYTQREREKTSCSPGSEARGPEAWGSLSSVHPRSVLSWGGTTKKEQDGNHRGQSCGEGDRSRNRWRVAAEKMMMSYQEVAWVRPVRTEEGAAESRHMSYLCWYPRSLVSESAQVPWKSWLP